MKSSSASVRIILLLVLLSFVFFSCDLFKSNNPVSPSGDDKIELGDEVELINTQSSAGSKVIVNKAGDALNGLTINIPDGIFDGNRIFKISSYEIKKHELGQYVNPISPLIKITSSGGYAKGAFEVKIPIQLADGEFPLVFIYDDNTKKLEPLPLDSYDQTSVTVLTRHFSTSKLTAGSIISKDAPVLQSDEAYTKMLVSSMRESLIKQTPVISSGFRLGVDDWEFVNRGSYISPGGHCAGQTMGALWYYYEMKLKGEPNLFGLLKKHPILWQDNNRGYRFCSVLQEDQDWDGMVSSFFWKHIDKEQSLDKMKFYLIAGAMLATGEPQNIGIYRQTGTNQDGTPKYGGHALICYQVEPASGKLLIADPNYPAVPQSINFVNDRFLPYEGKLNADDVVNSYPMITYYAKTAVIEWDKIADRWKEVINYKIGTVEPNKFPSYQLWSPDNGGFEIDDEIDIDFDTLNVWVKVPGAEACYTINGESYGDVDIYRADGGLFAKAVLKNDIFFVFNTPGSYKYGFEIYAFREKAKYSNGEYKPRFIDFRWVTINYKKSNAKIIPNKMSGDANIEYTWNMDVSDLPKEKKYYIVWSMGDDKSDVKKSNENFIKYKYEVGGSYRLIAKLYDESNNKMMARDTAYAEIAGVGGISPGSGPAGQLITITGSGFGNRNDGDDVTLHWTVDSTNHNYRAITTKTWSDNKIEAVVADETKNFIGKVFIKVRKYNKDKMSYKWFGPWEFDLQKCKVELIDPDTISTGDLLTINGENFGAKAVGDTVLFDNLPVASIVSWSNSTIVCEAVEMPAQGDVSVYVSKQSYKQYKSEESPYWKPKPANIANYLKSKLISYGSMIKYKVNTVVTSYNNKGEPYNTHDFEYDDTRYLDASDSKESSFSANGLDFQSSFKYNSTNITVSYSGTVSKDGKTLESLTITRYDGEKLELRIVLKDVPLINYGKYYSNFSWEYGTNSAQGYLTDFYMASYYNDGKLQTDYKLKNAVNVRFNFSCKFID